MYEIFEQLLKQHHMTAYKVAKETGITTATLTSWKQGKYIPKQDKLQIIADFFGVSLDYLLGREEKPSKDMTFDDFSYAMYNEGKELSEDNKAKLLEMARFFKEQQLKEK